jgi:hypothetical protein
MAIIKTNHRISEPACISWVFVSVPFPFSPPFVRSHYSQNRFYFPGILVGPYLDFSEYMEVINETMFQHAHVKATLKAGRTVPRGRKRAAYSKMIMGLLFLGVFVVLGPKYSYKYALKPEFARKSLLHR